MDAAQVYLSFRVRYNYRCWVIITSVSVKHMSAELAGSLLQESPNRLRNLWKQAVNDTAAGLTPGQQAQLVQEHCKVFAFNNAIVSGFRVSPTDWPLAVFRTVQILPARLKILLGLSLMFCAWCAAQFWTLLRRL